MWLQVLQKKRLVFGDRHMSRVATARAAAAAEAASQDAEGSEEGSSSVPPADALAAAIACIAGDEDAASLCAWGPDEYTHRELGEETSSSSLYRPRLH